MLIDFHRVSFEDVFPDFAGRMRGPAPAYLPVNVSFGRFRGVPYEEVPEECARLFQRTGGLIDQLDGLRRSGADDLDEQALRVAAYVHCEVVRIHPFVNGNGRMARLCLHYFARRYGMRPINYERTNGGYIDANRTWPDRRVIDHFVDFLRPRWKRRGASNGA